jgi:UDP-N-acetylglucosamine acyltransferase
MGQSHVAHNCEISDGVILANQVMLAGHVKVGQGAFFSAHAMAHQFVRIGMNAMISGAGLMVQDVPNFVSAAHRGEAVGINTVGMKRAGFDREGINEVRKLFGLLTRRGGQSQRECMQEAEPLIKTDAGRLFADFFNQESKRGVIACRKWNRRSSATSDVAEDAGLEG